MFWFSNSLKVKDSRVPFSLSMHIYPERCYGWLVWIMSHVSLCYIAAINMRIGNRWDSSSDITHALLLHSSTALSIWFYSNLTRLFVVKSATFWLYAISHSIWCPSILRLPRCEHSLTSSGSSSLPLEVILESPCLLAACFWISLLFLCDKD